MTQRQAPARASAPTSATRLVARGALRGTGAFLRFAGRRPTMVLASLAVCGGAGVFAWNATMTQTARHPAPLFSTPKPVAAKPEAKPEPQRRADAPLTTGTTRIDTPTPPARPAGPDAIGSIIRAGEPGAKTAEAKPKPAEAKPKVADAKPVDAKPKTTEAKPAEAKPKAADAKPVDAKPQPRVASAQKALAKLGYGPIVADGRLGSGTKQALEKFEKDKKLPVTGALGTRTAKQLASLSGVTIE